MFNGARGIVLAMNDGGRARQRAEHGKQIGRLLAAYRVDRGLLVEARWICATNASTSPWPRVFAPLFDSTSPSIRHAPPCHSRNAVSMASGVPSECPTSITRGISAIEAIDATMRAAMLSRSCGPAVSIQCSAIAFMPLAAAHAAKTCGLHMVPGMQTSVGSASSPLFRRVKGMAVVIDSTALARSLAQLGRDE